MNDRETNSNQLLGELDALRQQVETLRGDSSRRQQLAERRSAVTKLRDEVLEMKRAADIQQVAARLRAVLEGIGFPFDAFGINAAEESAEGVRFYAYTHDEEDINKPLPAGQAAILEGFWRAGEPVYRPDIQTDDPYGERDYLSHWKIRSVLDIPFSHGTIAASSRAPDAFSEHDIETLAELSQVLAEGFQRMDDFQVLEQSERRYRTLVETPPDIGVMFLDLTGRYLYISPQIEQMTGYPPEAFYADREIARHIVHPDNFAAGEQAFLQAAQGEIPPAREFRWQNQDGSYRWASETFLPIYDSRSEVEGVQIVVRDTTERKQAEETQRELERLRVLTEAAGGAAHEINQPLQGIVGLTEMLLLNMDTDDPRRPKLRNILEQAGRIHEILDNMQHIHRYTTKPYPGGAAIVDFDAASGQDADSQNKESM